jgi:hypothetical protein
LIQRALGVVEPGAGEDPGPGRVLAVAAFAGDLEELADGSRIKIKIKRRKGRFTGLKFKRRGG